MRVYAEPYIHILHAILPVVVGVVVATAECICRVGLVKYTVRMGGERRHEVLADSS